MPEQIINKPTYKPADLSRAEILRFQLFEIIITPTLYDLVNYVKTLKNHGSLLSYLENPLNKGKIETEIRCSVETTALMEDKYFIDELKQGAIGNAFQAIQLYC